MTREGSDRRCVCVTGAAGYLGSHIILDLLPRGHRVHATVRDPSDTVKRTHLDVMAEAHPGRLEIFQGDLLEARSFNEALDGCDSLIHTATALRFSASDPQRDIVDVAVEGTKNVLQGAAKTESLEHIVMTSSVAAIMSFGKPNGAIFDENDWCDSDDVTVDPYGMAKAASERLLWSFVDTQEGRIKATTINPGYLIGPPLAKHHVDGSISAIRDLVTRNYPACPRIRFCLADVRDVAAAHIRALDRPNANGKRIIVVNRSLWLRDIAMVLAPHHDVPKRTLPNFLAYAASVFDKRLSLSYMRSVIDYEYGFRSDRAKELLSIDHRDLNESIIETAKVMVDAEWT